MTSLKVPKYGKIKPGTLVELKPDTMCWPVEITNSRVTGKPIDEGNVPKTGAFYWGWTHDSGNNKLEGRLVPREKIIGFALGKTVILDIRSFKWEKNWHGKHTLDLFYTDKHGILATRVLDIAILYPNFR